MMCEAPQAKDHGGLGKAWTLRDDDLAPAFVEGCDDHAAVERVVPGQRTKIIPSMRDSTPRL